MLLHRVNAADKMNFANGGDREESAKEREKERPSLPTSAQKSGEERALAERELAEIGAFYQHRPLSTAIITSMGSSTGNAVPRPDWASQVSTFRSRPRFRGHFRLSLSLVAMSWGALLAAVGSPLVCHSSVCLSVSGDDGHTGTQWCVLVEDRCSREWSSS